MLTYIAASVHLHYVDDHMINSGEAAVVDGRDPDTVEGTTRKQQW